GDLPAQLLTNSNAVAGTVTYTITATASGCAGTPAQFVLMVNPSSVANAGADTVSCGPVKNKILGTAAVAGNDYSWNTNPPTAFFSTDDQASVSLISNTNRFVLRVMNSATCVAYDTVRVTILSVPSSNLGADVSICSGDTVVAGPSMEASVNYQWASLPAGFS